MAAVRDAWTDERLDDLNVRVDRIDQRMEAGFKDMRDEFRAVRAEMRGEFAAVRVEFSGQLTQLNHTIVKLFGGMIATFVVGIVAILTQV